LKLLAPGLSLTATTVAACLALIGYRFSRLPGWRDQRWFWLIAATASLYTGFSVFITLDVPDWVIRLGAHGNWLALSLHVVAWNLHAAAHHNAPLSRLERGFMLSTAAVGALALLPTVLLEERIVVSVWEGLTYRTPPTTALGDVAGLLLYAGFVAPLVRFLRAARVDSNARRYGAGMLALCFTGANDLIAASGEYSLPYLLDAGFLVLALLVWSVLVDRFTTATHRLDMLSTQLEGLVSERTQALAKAHEALAQAERLAAIGRLSAGVAHEINNPSAAVVSNLTYLQDALADGELPDDAGEALRDSLASMGKIARIVRQLLDTGRVAASDSSVRSAFNLARAVENAVHTARLALDRPVEVELAVPDTVAIGDPLMVEQVLVNLLVNGVQAVPEARSPYLEIRAEVLTNAVRLLVRDNGTGMPAEVASRAFEPFFSTKPFGKGTGLGLSVSLGLAKALGGDLRIARTSSEGTTMELLLRSSGRLSSVPPPTSARSSRPLQRLLVVDDDPVVREGLSRMLSRAFVVETAIGVSDARDAVAAAHFDAILCDVMMDEGGGEAFFSWLQRERPSLAEHVIFVTGGITDETAQRFLERQAQPVLYKPVDLTAVERAVDEVVRQSQASVRVLSG
jgi:signal transduction histidine kinase/ActR/RegA family two-component response regulator